MRIEPGLVIVDSTEDLLSAWCPAPFGVLRKRYLSAWHYLMYMKAMRLQLYGTADRIVAIASLDDLPALEAPMLQVDQGRWLQEAWSDMDLANWRKFSDNPDMAELLLGTGSQLIVSTTHPDTFWSAPALTEGQSLHNKLTWIRRNTEGISLMRTRDRIAASRAPGPAPRSIGEPKSLQTLIEDCVEWDPEFSYVMEKTYWEWVDEVRAAPRAEIIDTLHAFMRKKYWDVDIDHPLHFELVQWVRSVLEFELPEDPALGRGGQRP